MGVHAVNGTGPSESWQVNSTSTAEAAAEEAVQRVCARRRMAEYNMEPDLARWGREQRVVCSQHAETWSCQGAGLAAGEKGWKQRRQAGLLSHAFLCSAVGFNEWAHAAAGPAALSGTTTRCSQVCGYYRPVVACLAVKR
eukprot:scaffold203090_cov17-Tisochrysis_lutea.AAC.1